MDLSFLDDEEHVDKTIDAIVNAMCSIHAIYMSNSDPDVRIVEALNPDALDLETNRLFPNAHDNIQMVVPNGHESKYFCGYFRIVMSGYGMRSPINYKFETFMRAANIQSIYPRCTAALVVGLEPVHNVPLSVPTFFRLTSLEHLQIMGDIDMTCMQSIAGAQTSEDLVTIAGGVPLPSCLPDDIHWKIFRYLQHPCATMIKREMDRRTMFWELHLFLMQQPIIGDWYMSDSDSDDDDTDEDDNADMILE